MNIAFITTPERGQIDRLLTETATRLAQQNVRLAGIVKDLSHDSAFANGCDMKVRVLPEGPVIKITQDLGKGSDACRLNPTAIAEAVAQVEQGDLSNAQVFILNKFGPEEAAGHGFRAIIGKALELGIPVVVGVSAANRQEFDAFTEDQATALAAESDAICAWCLAALPAS